MRRFATLAILTGLVVLTAALQAGAILPPAVSELIQANGNGGGCFFLPDHPQKVLIGQGVDWSNSDSAASHRVKQREGFWSFTVAANDDVLGHIHSAGTYVSQCDSGTEETDRALQTRVKAPSSTSNPNFNLTWADSKAADALHYSIRFKVGTGTFRAWKTKTAARSATFHGHHNKTYRFEARSIKSGKATGWSPPKTVKVT